MAHNQEIVVEENEHSPDFQRYRKRSNNENEDQEVLSGSSDGVQVNLTRSDAFVGQGSFKDYNGNRFPRPAPASQFRPRHVWPAKEPMHQPMEESDSDDEEDKDLAWFFRKHHPALHKVNQIAWCRTYANCLAAQIPKNRPKTYKKKAKTEENIYKIKGI